MTFTDKEKEALMRAAEILSVQPYLYSCVIIKRAMHKLGFSDFECREMVRQYAVFHGKQHEHIWFSKEDDEFWGKDTALRSLMVLFFLEAHNE